MSATSASRPSAASRGTLVKGFSSTVSCGSLALQLPRREGVAVDDGRRPDVARAGVDGGLVGRGDRVLPAALPAEQVVVPRGEQPDDRVVARHLLQRLRERAHRPERGLDLDGATRALPARAGVGLRQLEEVGEVLERRRAVRVEVAASEPAERPPRGRRGPRSAAPRRSPASLERRADDEGPAQRRGVAGPVDARWARRGRGRRASGAAPRAGGGPSRRARRPRP